MNTLKWLLTLVYACVTFYMSVITSTSAPLFPQSDKVLHFLIYAGLSFLLMWSLDWSSKRGLKVPVISVSIAVLFGTMIEIVQIYVPTRYADVVDAVANTLGSVLGVCIYRVLWLRFAAFKIRLR